MQCPWKMVLLLVRSIKARFTKTVQIKSKILPNCCTLPLGSIESFLLLPNGA